ncbi:hypothetical protein N7499_012211, partial [Penicillium canescens]
VLIVGGYISPKQAYYRFNRLFEVVVRSTAKCLVPEPPLDDVLDIENSAWNRQQLNFLSIIGQELADAIRRTSPDKAPRPDGIPNVVWRLLASESA